MGDYMNFVMPVVASVDSSRPIWRATASAAATPYGQPLLQLQANTCSVALQAQLPGARVGHGR